MAIPRSWGLWNLKMRSGEAQIDPGGQILLRSKGKELTWSTWHRGDRTGVHKNTVQNSSATAPVDMRTSRSPDELVATREEVRS